MKTIFNKKDRLAKKIIEEIEKRHPELLEQIRKEEPIIQRITSIKLEKGLRQFNI
jgi:hypothetical protein